MARTGFQPSSPLDREIESSLRRQFAVPAVGLLPSAMVAGGAAAGAAAGAASGGGLRLDFSLDFSLRQAAGIALAASLWMGAGYLLFAQFDRPDQVVSASFSRQGPGIAPDSPLAHLLNVYDEARLDSSTPGSESSPEDALWQQLQDEMVKRRGDGIIPHIRQLREKSQSFELLAVESGKDGSEDSLFVSAIVNDVVTSALIQLPDQGDPQAVSMAGVAEVPTPETVAPQLFMTKFPDGHGIEVAAAGDPLLTPLLLPETTVEATLPLERGRNRKVHAVAAPMPLKG